MKKELFAFVAAAALGACAAAPDEAWIRITEIRESGEETTSATVIRADLRDSSTDTVDVEVENFTTILGSSGNIGVGIEVYRARVEYTLGGYDFPDYEYPVTLYLPPPGGESATTTGTINGLPVAPATLKGWILDPGNFPRELLRQPVRLEAKIIVRAKTDEGKELDTAATVSVEFTSGPAAEGGDDSPAP